MEAQREDLYHSVSVQGEGKGGFGIEGQLRPVFIEELTVVEQVGPTAAFSWAPSIFGCIFSTLTDGVILLFMKNKEKKIEKKS